MRGKPLPVFSAAAKLLCLFHVCPGCLTDVALGIYLLFSSRELQQAQRSPLLSLQHPALLSQWCHPGKYSPMLLPPLATRLPPQCGPPKVLCVRPRTEGAWLGRQRGGAGGRQGIAGGDGGRQHARRGAAEADDAAARAWQQRQIGFGAAQSPAPSALGPRAPLRRALVPLARRPDAGARGERGTTLDPGAAGSETSERWAESPILAEGAAL